MSDYKKDLKAIYEDIAKQDILDDDQLFVTHSQLEVKLSDVSQKLKRPLNVTPIPTIPSEGTGVKLPRLEVPTFDGNLIHWKQFWDQFSTAVHNKPGLSNAEKTVYLQQAIRDGPARSVIEGLSHSGDNYEEAVSCLRSRYDRPRLIQRTHVQAIVDTPSPKDGSGKELRKLHDCLQQHIRALSTLGCDLPGTFLTSMIELKLDVDTLFEWQKHSQENTGVPPYEDLLDFIDLRAQASEVSSSSNKRTVIPHVKKVQGKVMSLLPICQANALHVRMKDIRFTSVLNLRQCLPMTRLKLLRQTACAPIAWVVVISRTTANQLTNARCARGLITLFCTWTLRHLNPLILNQLLRWGLHPLTLV